MLLTLCMGLGEAAGAAAQEEAKRLTEGPAEGPAEGTVFLEVRVLDQPALFEITPFGRAQQHRDALTGALEAANVAVRLADPSGPPELAGLGALNQAAGKGAVSLDPRLLFPLERALNFCGWSRRAHGPLGGNLYGLWGLRQPVYALPSDSALAQQVQNTACERLTLDSTAQTAVLAGGSRVDLHGFVEGWAVDNAVDVLVEAGATAGKVRIGRVVRSFGSQPHQQLPSGTSSRRKTREGWPVAATPTDDALVEERVVLKDQALAVASRAGKRIEIAGDVWPGYIHQATGRPTVDSKLAVMAVSELAIDAQGLAVSLWLLNPREGRYRIGSLSPQPSVLWMMGSGDVDPLLIQQGWARLEKWP